MMVPGSSGLFKDIHGEMGSLSTSRGCAIRGEIGRRGLLDRVSEGLPTPPARADFFDVENHPKILFEGRFIERTGDTSFKVAADLTIRATTHEVPLDVNYLGQWKTPFWEGEENRGTLTRTGFQATARINRHDFGVSWQDQLPGGGVVVSNEIAVELNVEAILVDDLEATGAITTTAKGYAG